MYDPTETTIWSSVSDLTNKDRIDIGRPIKNTEIYIVDENLSILSDGQSGEICIAGKGLAKGYVGRRDLTVERFICLPQEPDVKVFELAIEGAICLMEIWSIWGELIIKLKFVDIVLNLKK